MPKRTGLPLSRYNNKRYRKKLSVWQREKEKKRAAKHTKTVVGALVIFFVLVFAWHAIGFVKFFIDFFHFGEAQNVVQQGRTNLVLDFGQISLVSIDTENNTMFIANLLPEVYTKLAQGGEYKLVKTYEIGELTAKGDGGKLLTQSVQELFDIPIDGYVKLTKPYDNKSITVEELKDTFGSVSFLLHFLRSRNFDGHIDTNLSAFDTLSLWWHVRGIRSDKIDYVVFDDTNKYEQKELADGSKVLGISEITIDQVVGDRFVDSLIAKENVRVRIINASGKPGVANNMARLILHTGGEVIRVETADQVQEKSKIIVSKEGSANQLIKRLSKLQKFDIIAPHSQYDDLSDVTIIIGTDSM